MSGAKRLCIVIDTREQIPWGFDPAHADTTVGTLKTGDYALAGDPFFGIERKSLDDFLGTISTGWGRFVRELNRMDAEGWVAKVIIVEGDYAHLTFAEDPAGELVPPRHRHWMLTPQFIERRIAELTMRGVSVLFAKDAALAAGLAVAILRERNRDIEHQNRNAADSELQAGNTR